MRAGKIVVVDKYLIDWVSVGETCWDCCNRFFMAWLPFVTHVTQPTASEHWMNYCFKCCCFNWCYNYCLYKTLSKVKCVIQQVWAEFVGLTPALSTGYLWIQLWKKLLKSDHICSTQCPLLPSWPSFRTFTWQGLETSSWSSSRWLDRPTPQQHWICSCQPLEIGHPTGPWWSDVTAQTGYAMTTTTFAKVIVQIQVVYFGGPECVLAVEYGVYVGTLGGDNDVVWSAWS